MKNLKLFFAAVIFCMGMSANAQVEEGLKYGIKAGANFSSLMGDERPKEMKGKIGFNAGFFIEYNMANNLYVLSGLELTTKGDMYKETEGSDTYKQISNLMYIQLPIHIGYRMGIAEDMALGIHAGPYLAYGISGKVKDYLNGKKIDYEEFEDYNDDFFGSKKDGGMKPFDAGIGIGLDLDYKQFRIGAGYDLGLMNMNRSEDKDDAIKNGNFYLSVGYKF